MLTLVSYIPLPITPHWHWILLKQIPWFHFIHNYISAYLWKRIFTITATSILDLTISNTSLTSSNIQPMLKFLVVSQLVFFYRCLICFGIQMVPKHYIWLPYLLSLSLLKSRHFIRLDKTYIVTFEVEIDIWQKTWRTKVK